MKKVIFALCCVSAVAAAAAVIYLAGSADAVLEDEETAA